MPEGVCEFVILLSCPAVSGFCCQGLDSVSCMSACMQGWKTCSGKITSASCTSQKETKQHMAACSLRAALRQIRPCVSSSAFVTLTASDGLAGSATTRPAPPLAPHPPTPSSIAASSFKLSWASPLSRGAPVTEYLVSVQQPAAIADSNGHNSLAGAEPTAMSNGHADANGNGVMDSMDDASSTSGSTAHVQVGGTKHLKSIGLRTPEPTCKGGSTYACVYHASACSSSCTCTMSSKWTLIVILLCMRVCMTGQMCS